MEHRTKRILFVSGIVFPEVGGPATYVRHLGAEFAKRGIQVDVVSYDRFSRKLPIGLRHFVLFLKVLRKGFVCDQIWAFDVFSAGLPAYYAAQILRKNFVIRVGGDSLWEAYVARTQELVLLSEFYSQKRLYTYKEKLMYRLISRIVAGSHAVVFSTKWMKDIWQKPYRIKDDTAYIIENAYVFYDAVYTQPIKKDDVKKVFVCPTRETFFKNKATVLNTFAILQKTHTDVVLDTHTMKHEAHIKRLAQSYVVMIPSLSEVSPNLLLDALSVGIPYIMTKDSGYADLFPKCGILVDPRDVGGMVHAMEQMLDADAYAQYKQHAMGVRIQRTYRHVADDFIKYFIA